MAGAGAPAQLGGLDLLIEMGERNVVEPDRPSKRPPATTASAVAGPRRRTTSSGRSESSSASSSAAAAGSSRVTPARRVPGSMTRMSWRARSGASTTSRRTGVRSSTVTVTSSMPASVSATEPSQIDEPSTRFMSSSPYMATWMGPVALTAVVQVSDGASPDAAAPPLAPRRGRSQRSAPAWPGRGHDTRRRRRGSPGQTRRAFRRRPRAIDALRLPREQRAPPRDRRPARSGALLPPRRRTHHLRAGEIGARDEIAEVVLVDLGTGHRRHPRSLASAASSRHRSLHCAPPSWWTVTTCSWPNCSVIRARASSPTSSSLRPRMTCSGARLCARSASAIRSGPRRCRRW